MSDEGVFPSGSVARISRESSFIHRPVYKRRHWLAARRLNPLLQRYGWTVWFSFDAQGHTTGPVKMRLGRMGKR